MEKICYVTESGSKGLCFISSLMQVTRLEQSLSLSLSPGQYHMSSKCRMYVYHVLPKSTGLLLEV